MGNVEARHVRIACDRGTLDCALAAFDRASLQCRRVLVDAVLQRSRAQGMGAYVGSRRFLITPHGAEPLKASNGSHSERPWWQRVREPEWVTMWVYAPGQVTAPILYQLRDPPPQGGWPVYRALHERHSLIWCLLLPAGVDANDAWRQLGAVHVDDQGATGKVVARLRTRFGDDVDAHELELMAKRCVHRSSTFVAETVPAYSECAGVGTDDTVRRSLLDFAQAHVVASHAAVPINVRRRARSITVHPESPSAMAAFGAELRNCVEQYCLDQLVPLKRLHRAYWLRTQQQPYDAEHWALWTLLRAADWLEFWGERGYGFAPRSNALVSRAIC